MITHSVTSIKRIIIKLISIRVIELLEVEFKEIFK
jgi:hypothetical protein